MSQWKKLMSLLFIASASATAQMAALERQEMQLAPNLKMYYQDLQKTEDQTKSEYTITDPHLIWFDSNLESDAILAEEEHKGKLHVVLDFKANRIYVESNGLSHCFINIQQLIKKAEAGRLFSTLPPNLFKVEETGNLDFNAEGKAAWDISIDFAKAKGPIDQIQSGNFNAKTILALLESIQAFSEKATHNKTFGPGMVSFFLEKELFNYKHSSGENPENFTFSSVIVSAPQMIMGDQKITFPQRGDIFQQSEGSFSLPAWEKLYNYAISKGEGLFPGMVLNMQTNSTSKAGDINWSVSLSSKRQANVHSFEKNIHLQTNLSPNWVQAYQNATVETITNAPNSIGGRARGLVVEVVNWLNRPATAKFLALAPLQAALDINSSITNTSEPFSIDAVKVYLSWLGKQNTGLIVAVNYDKQKTNYQVTIAGGQEVVGYAIHMYNAFTDTLPQPNMPKFSPAARDDFITLLTSYAASPDKAHTELIFDITTDNNLDIKIGGKSIFNFISDILKFEEKYFSKNKIS